MNGNIQTAKNWTEFASHGYTRVKMCILTLGNVEDSYYPDSPEPAKIYSAKLTKNGKVVFDLVPCVRESDGEAGFYDLVTQRFLSNDGAGRVLYGADVYGIPVKYEAVSYIKYTGEQEMLLPCEITKDTRIEITLSFDIEGKNTFPIYSASEAVSLRIEENTLRYDAFEGMVEESDLYTNTKYIFASSFAAEHALAIGDRVLSAEAITFAATNGGIKLFGAAERLNGNVAVYRIKIFDSAEVRCDLIPCIRKKDGKVGLYDCVNKVFYPSSVGEFECDVRFEPGWLSTLYEEMDSVRLDEEHTFDLDQDGAEDYIPAKRKSDGSLGFFGKTTGIFYAVYDNGNNFLMGEVVGHDLAETRVLAEASERQSGEVVRICRICGKEIHDYREPYAYKVEFVCGVGIKEVRVYKGYDFGTYETTKVAYTRNRYTNNYSRVDGQVCYEIIAEDGYEIEVYAKDCKLSESDDGIRVLSYVEKDTTVHVFARKSPQHF